MNVPCKHVQMHLLDGDPDNDRDSDLDGDPDNFDPCKLGHFITLFATIPPDLSHTRHGRCSQRQTITIVSKNRVVWERLNCYDQGLLALNILKRGALSFELSVLKKTHIWTPFNV